MRRWPDRREFKACVLEWSGKLGVEVRSLYVRRPERTRSGTLLTPAQGRVDCT
jgi:hypothetical protein